GMINFNQCQIYAYGHLPAAIRDAIPFDHALGCQALVSDETAYQHTLIAVDIDVGHHAILLEMVIYFKYILEANVVRRESARTEVKTLLLLAVAYPRILVARRSTTHDGGGRTEITNRIGWDMKSLSF